MASGSEGVYRSSMVPDQRSCCGTVDGMSHAFAFLLCATAEMGLGQIAGIPCQPKEDYSQSRCLVTRTQKTQKTLAETVGRAGAGYPTGDWQSFRKRPQMIERQRMTR